MILYTVYKTTNTQNNKYYIGVHKTNNPDDNYLGSGIALKQAIKKYGRKIFKKEVLFKFETSEQAYTKEKELVTQELLMKGETYNLTKGGIPSINWPNGERKITSLKGELHPMWGKTQDLESNKKRSDSLKKSYAENPRDPSVWEKVAKQKRGVPSPIKGSIQTEESNIKRSLSHLALVKKICPICQRSISPSNFNRHVLIHSE